MISRIFSRPLEPEPFGDVDVARPRLAGELGEPDVGDEARRFALCFFHHLTLTFALMSASAIA